MATIRDVARAAGVSTATVSRVFNDNSLVSDETAERVAKVASELDYWPNAAARSLTTNQSQTIGVLLPDLYGEFFSEIIRGIDSATRAQKFQILLSGSHAKSEDVLAAARTMLGRIDGLLMMAPEASSIETVQRLSRRITVVLLNPHFQIPDCSSISVDNFGGAYALTTHLLGLGHRRIALIKGPEGNRDAQERARGFRFALAEAGSDPARAVMVDGDFREHSGYEAARTLLACPERPTAVFATNDCMAIGLMSALRLAGLNVPRDMAVAGFDNQTTARYMNPALTTVDVDACALGREAVNLLLEDLNHDAAPSQARRILPTTLTIRESCGDILRNPSTSDRLENTGGS